MLESLLVELVNGLLRHDPLTSDLLVTPPLSHVHSIFMRFLTCHPPTPRHILIIILAEAEILLGVSYVGPKMPGVAGIRCKPTAPGLNRAS